MIGSFNISFLAGLVVLFPKIDNILRVIIDYLSIAGEEEKVEVDDEEEGKTEDMT